MVPLRNTLIEMVWPQPKAPIQCDNSTAVGVSNNTIIQRKTKTTNMQYQWLRSAKLKVNSVSFGLLYITILPITAPKITPLFTMKPIGILMWDKSTHYVHCKGVWILVESIRSHYPISKICSLIPLSPMTPQTKWVTRPHELNFRGTSTSVHR